MEEYKLVIDDGLNKVTVEEKLDDGLLEVQIQDPNKENYVTWRDYETSDENGVPYYNNPFLRRFSKDEVLDKSAQIGLINYKLSCLDDQIIGKEQRLRTLIAQLKIDYTIKNIYMEKISNLKYEIQG